MDWAVRSIERDKARLVYDDAGEGSAVLFSHGWLCDSRQWPQAPAVARAGHRVLNLDNRGHGRSGPYTEPYSLWDVADDLVAVLDDAGEEQAVVVGQSLGGFAALRMALRYPSRVRGLVLGATTSGVLRHLDKAQARASLAIARTPASRLLTPMLPKLLFGPSALREPSAMVVASRRRCLGQFSARTLSMVCAGDAALTARQDLTSQLGRIAVPTLVLVGEEDTYLAESARMAGRIPGAQLVVLPRAGHMSPLEAPDRFEHELLKFLRAIDLAATTNAG
jgi:pimeloyl-ACP methyl ester carboxylesterase